MRLVFDLFPCQTNSRLRGIGRYTQSLADSMARLRGGHDMYALVNGGYPDSADALRKSIGSLLPPGRFSAYTHTTPEDLANSGADNTAVATALIHSAYQALTPDVVLYGSIFEDQGVIPLPQGNLPSALRVAVLYDFIPHLFPSQYLHVPRQRKWYEERLAALHQFDLLLAISEATRQDAINILGIAPERVVNIAGAASEIFRPVPPSEGTDIARFGIMRPFVLYTGNADYRKNQDGMLEAYAGLPLALRQSHQLVLNQVGNIDSFRRRTRLLGLADEEVVVTGHITDDDLISLYSQCKVFVFPSLYEGFGLPALEAMACGAPVIAANNSSIPEVVGRSDVLFDAADTGAITAAMQKVLTDDELRKELASYGIERTKAFSWTNTATLAWQAIEQCLAAKAAAPVPPQPKPRIAVVCPLSSPDTPAARHTAILLPQLASMFDIDLYIEDGAMAEAPPLPEACAIYPHTELATRYELYATVVYQMANAGCHAFMLPLMVRYNGVVVLHDIAMDEPLKVLARQPGMASILASETLYCHGLQGLLSQLKQDVRHGALPLNRRVLESAEQIVALNTADADCLSTAGFAAWLPPITLLPDSDPKAMLAAYARVIHAAIACDQKHVLRHIADALEDAAPDDTVLGTIAGHAASNRHLRKQPRLLVDVTQLARTDARSGIQRVVRNIAREIVHLVGPDRPIELVRHSNGKLRRASSVVASIFEVAVDAIPEQEMLIQPGDTLLMIDSSWEQYGEFLPVFQLVRQLGGKIITVVYDIIPLRLPELCLPALVGVFRNWFPMAVQQSDALLCISRAVAEDAAAYLSEQAVQPVRKPEFLHWPLGADIAVRASETVVREQVQHMAADDATPLFLMVGTIEPRKGHVFALDAFEELWRDGVNARLCIAGAVGWIPAETMERIRNHPQLNKKLFFIESFTDAEIGLCYAAATALIAASVSEGFGLPIVEAALHKVPTLASDIPVFREVGGEGARYFSLASPHCLAEAVLEFITLSKEERLALASKIRTVTWRTSAERLLSAIEIDAGGGGTEYDSSACTEADSRRREVA